MFKMITNSYKNLFDLKESKVACTMSENEFINHLDQIKSQIKIVL